MSVVIEIDAPDEDVPWGDLIPGSDEYFERVLLEINSIREEHGMESISALPQGVRHEGFRTCAVGEAFNCLREIAQRAVFNGIVDTVEPRVTRQCSNIIADYENRFELGQFPQLERTF